MTHKKNTPTLFYTYYDSPIGRLLMLSDGENLTNLDCELEQTTPNPHWILREDLSLFQRVREALTRYFNGEAETFEDIPLAPQGTVFQQAIWCALRQIPTVKPPVTVDWPKASIILKRCEQWEAR